MKKLGLLVLAGAIVGGWLLFRSSKANAQVTPPPVIGDTGTLIIKAGMGKMPIKYDYKVTPLDIAGGEEYFDTISDIAVMDSGQRIILPVGKYHVRVIAYYKQGDAVVNPRTEADVVIQKDKKFIFYHNK